MSEDEALALHNAVGVLKELAKKNPKNTVYSFVIWELQSILGGENG